MEQNLKLLRFDTINRAKEKFLKDYGSTPIASDHVEIDAFDFWAIAKLPTTMSFCSKETSAGFFKAEFYHEGYLYVHYSIISDTISDSLDFDTFCCKYTSDDLPLPSDHWNDGMYEEF
jgi:hypothetical protein